MDDKEVRFGKMPFKDVFRMALMGRVVSLAYLRKQKNLGFFAFRFVYTRKKQHRLWINSVVIGWLQHEGEQGRLALYRRRQVLDKTDSSMQDIE